MPIQAAHGDLITQDDVDAIVNTCRAGAVRPGTMHVFDAGPYAQPHYIIHFPTKDHWRGHSKMAFIADGLRDWVAHHEPAVQGWLVPKSLVALA